MSNYKKIDRKFTHSDSSKNVYGFRLLTSGYLIDEFLKNPIGYYNHKDDEGVLVRWEDVKIEGDKVTGYPVINMSHCRGWRAVEEIESGFLNAASVGDIVILEHHMEADPENPDMLILVATKWYNKETSLVDKPGNRGEVGEEGGAFAEPLRLFDATGQLINLSDLTNKKIKPLMKKLILPLTPALVGMLGLSDDGDNANEHDVTERIKNLSDKAKKVPVLEAKITELTGEKDKAVKDLSDYKAETSNEKVTKMLADALEKGQLTKDLSDTLGEQYKGRPEDLQKVIDKMPVYESLADRTKKLAGDIPEKFLNKSLMDLQSEDLLEEVRDNYPNLYDQVKKEHQEGKKKK